MTAVSESGLTDSPLVHTIKNSVERPKKGLPNSSSPQIKKSSPFPERNTKKDYEKGLPKKRAKSSSMRIKINKRTTKKGTYYHWLYAVKINGKEKTRYGGAIDTLPDPSRFEQYKKRSKRYGQKK